MVLGILLPLNALALDFKDESLLYTDAPFSPAESAGISVLTEIGAVEGNPDGTFQPGRTLNRAEFLKIVFESYPRIASSNSDADNCFPDVHTEDWFSRYVCLAKRRNVVQGYPDGNFRPANPVNYAEALKILGEMYDYTAYAEPDAPWYQVYVQAAMNHQTILPINLAYDAFLTRGQMARLAAAYRAEYENELDYYRAMERGDTVVKSSSSSSSVSSSKSSTSSVSSSVSSQSSSSSSSAAQTTGIPAKSQLILLGNRSKAIASATFTPLTGDVNIRSISVLLNREIKSFDKLYLIDQAGVQVGELTLDIYDKDDETWSATFAQSGVYILNEQEPTVFGIEAQLKERDNGGVPEELIQVERITIVAQDTETAESVNLIGASTYYPYHQTVQAQLTEVKNNGSVSGTLDKGLDRLIGEYSFRGQVLNAADLDIESLVFTLTASGTLAFTNWEVGVATSPSRHSCSVSNDTIINCLGIPDSIGGTVSGEAVIQLYADVTATGAGGVHADLLTSGAIGENGDVRWSDGTGHYTWTNFSAPIVIGTQWWLWNN